MEAKGKPGQEIYHLDQLMALVQMRHHDSLSFGYRSIRTEELAIHS